MPKQSPTFMYLNCGTTICMLRQKLISSHNILQGDSLARGPKLLSIKNYVNELNFWRRNYFFNFSTLCI